MTRWLTLLGVLIAGLVLTALLRGGARETAIEPPMEPLAADETLARDESLSIPRALPAAEERAAALPAGLRQEAQVERVASNATAEREGGTIVGRVVDDTGVPVAAFTIECGRPGARKPQLAITLDQVIAEGPDAALLKAQLRGRQRGANVHEFESTDGAFRLEGLAHGQWTLTARAGARVSAPQLAEPGGDAGTLVLPRAAAVAGRVVDSSAAPIEGAFVYVRPAGADRPPFYLDGVMPDSVSSGSGEFRLDGVAAGAFELVVRHPEYCESRFEGRVGPGETRAGIQVTLKAGGRIVGTLDPSLAKSEPRTVWLYSFDEGVGWQTTPVDARGEFAIEHVIPQDYVIELSQDTVSTEASLSSQASIRKHIRVEEGRTTEVLFGAPRRQITVHGSVLAMGRPAPRLTVSAYSPDGAEDRGQNSVTTADGRYELTLDGPGNYRFSVSEGRASAHFDREVPDQDSVELSFDLPAGVVAGRVLDASGRGQNDVPVTLVRDAVDGESSSSREDIETLDTASDGSFAFRMLRPGTYTLRAPDGLSRRVPHGRVVQRGIAVDGSRPVEGIEIRLAPEGMISGQVVDGAGNSIAGAWVVVRDASGVRVSADWETRSDALGHFDVFSLAPGTYTIDARSETTRGNSTPFLVEAAKTTSVRVELR